MFRGPPKDAFLGAALGKECKDELKRPACRISSMREVAMISGRDRKHAQPVQKDANCNRLPCDARPDRRHAPCVDKQKREDLRVHDVVVFLIRNGIGGHSGNLNCFNARNGRRRTDQASVSDLGLWRAFAHGVTRRTPRPGEPVAGSRNQRLCQYIRGQSSVAPIAAEYAATLVGTASQFEVWGVRQSGAPSARVPSIS